MDNIENNPIVNLLYYGSPYSDYIDDIKNTFNFKYYSKFIFEAKSTNWNISNELIADHQLRVIHSSILELFIEDDTSEMFYNIYSSFVKNTLNREFSIKYRDVNMNSIFHYDAVHGKSRLKAYTKIQNIHNELTKKSMGIDSEIFNQSILLDENGSGVKVIDIIKANS